MTEFEEKIKEFIPDYDETDPKKRDAFCKALILSTGDKILREMYFKLCVEVLEKAKITSFLDDKRQTREKHLEEYQKMLEFEQEILDRKKKVLKDFMN